MRGFCLWTALLFGTSGSLTAQDEIKNGKTFVSRKYNLTFSIPSANWGVMRLGKDLVWNWTGGVCEILDKNEDIGGCLQVEELAMTVEEYADAVGKSMATAPGVRSFKLVKNEKQGEWLRRDYLRATGGEVYHYVSLFGSKDKVNFRLCVWVLQSMWEEKKGEIDKVGGTLGWADKAADAEARGIEERRKLKEERLKDRNRKEFQTAHYKMEAGEVTGEMLKVHLENLYLLWLASLGAKPGAGKLAVRIHSSKEAYKKDVSVNSLAYYNPEEDRLYGLTGPSLANDIAREGTLQYLHKAYPNSFDAMPLWLKRGLAGYFGAVELSADRRPTMNSITSRDNFNNAQALKRLLRERKIVPLKTLVEEADKEFESAERIRDVEAWAFTWFLFNHLQADPVRKMLASLEAGKTRSEAMIAAFAQGDKIDWPKLEAEFALYWKNMKVDIADREDGDWLVGETEHYTLRVQKGTQNIKAKADDRAVLKDMKYKMELLFEKYGAAFKFDGKLSSRPLVRLYKNSVAYHQAGGPETSAAYYDPATKELVGYEDSAETGIVFQILCHEGCHQFFDLAFPGFYDSEDLPMWFSEGLADCFGSSEIRGKQLVVFTLSGVATWRVETIKRAITTNDAPTLRVLLGMDRESFMANGGLHYAQSWSFCHFLWNAPNLAGGGGVYREVVIRLIEGFKAGKSKDEVYRESFTRDGRTLDLDVLENEWKAYVKTLKANK